MPTSTLATPPLVLTPTNDPTPVELTVVDGTVGDFEPETFLWIVFHAAARTGNRAAHRDVFPSGVTVQLGCRAGASVDRTTSANRGSSP
ncbi:hypothetical protein [Streptomyces sp. NPDC057910]|uniref:hypothetical protein n=1 Tax=Streptomyces sp. NPDC057910 TaxID=3346278 RepID=UPI0036EE09B7